MKRVLFISALLFLIASSQAQNEILPVKSSNTILFAKDVKMNSDTTKDQRNVVVCSAFNGWLYAAYTYIHRESNQDFGAFVISKSTDSGVTWDIIFDAFYPNADSRFTCIDILAIGSEADSLKILIATVLSNDISGIGDPMVLKYNGNTGICEDGLLIDNYTSFIAIASDYGYPAVNSNPFSIGVLYSKSTQYRDSIIFCSSSNGGMTLDNRRVLATTVNRFQKVALSHGRSASKNSGRYFAVWEEKNAYNSSTGHIYTSHSEPNFNSPFTAPVRLDSIDPSAYNNARNPVIACQANNIDNDSSNLTEVILYDKYKASTNCYVVRGLVNRKATVSTHFTPFTLPLSSDFQKQPSVIFNPYDSTFLTTYYDSSAQKLPLLKSNFNLGNPNLWQIITPWYNDSSNLADPYPKVRLDHGMHQAMNVWNSEGSSGKGVALFDAPYSTYTGIHEIFMNPKSMLKGVFPNPASDRTTILFELKEKAVVSINLYSMEGILLKQTGNEEYAAGRQSINLNVSDLPPGTYLFNFTAGDFNSKGKIIVIK
ncbi:MAG: T9SS type A sorting domain-containing protein [Bacteroidota bacterium]